MNEERPGISIPTAVVGAVALAVLSSYLTAATVMTMAAVPEVPLVRAPDLPYKVRPAPVAANFPPPKLAGLKPLDLRVIDVLPFCL